MVRAILEGRKTQTRRVIKPQPRLERDILEPENAKAYLFAITTDVGTTEMLGKRNYTDRYSPFKSGMNLWVRETFAPLPGAPLDKSNGVIYRATEPENKWTWKPSIFMPRWASRITLEIVSVKVERLQEISEEDAIEEGVDMFGDGEDFGSIVYRDYSHPTGCVDFAKQSYKTLWDSINGKKYPWASNPWVWVVEFKRVL